MSRAAALAALLVGSVASGQVCSGLEDCDNGNRCYNPYGITWCNGTSVNVYNHTPFAAVNDSWLEWNQPPSGPSNALNLFTDGINGQGHDVDYWTTSSSQWWWGWSAWTSTGPNQVTGCFARGSGSIQFNTARMPQTYYAEKLTSLHETGHLLGLGHACACSMVMDPCFNCSSDTLATCDAQGAAALYPGSKCAGGGQSCARDTDCCDSAFCERGHCTQSWLWPQANGNAAMTLVNWPADGHAELFARSADGALMRTNTNQSTDTWSTPASLGAGVSCQPAAAFWLPNALHSNYAEVFADDLGGLPQHAFWSPTGWTALASFGTTRVGQLSSLSWPDGHPEVFGLGADGALWHDYWEPTVQKWSGWQALGAPPGRMLVSGAGALTWGDGHGELFAIDQGGSPWHSWSGNYPNGWSPWTALATPMPLTSRPVPVRWDTGSVEAFARGSDGHVYHSWFATGTGWSTFTVLGTQQIQGEPSVMWNIAGHGASTGPEVFARDLTGHVVHAWWNGSTWTSWSPLGSLVAASDPLGWLRANGDGEVFAIDAAGILNRILRTNSGWGSWSPIGGPFDPCTKADAGEPGDGGVPPTDAGEDAGAPAHLGLDAGAAFDDAGTQTPPARPPGHGCGSGAGNEQSPWVLVAALAALAASTRRRRSQARAAWRATVMAVVITVICGLTPRDVGKTDASATKRFLMSCDSPVGATTVVLGSAPIRHVPRGCEA